MKFLKIPKQKLLWAAVIWMGWHWGLLFFGLLPYPYPRLPVMYTALAIDGMMFITFFVNFYYHGIVRE